MSKTRGHKPALVLSEVIIYRLCKLSSLSSSARSCRVLGSFLFNFDGPIVHLGSQILQADLQIANHKLNKTKKNILNFELVRFSEKVMKNKILYHSKTAIN